MKWYCFLALLTGLMACTNDPSPTSNQPRPRLTRLDSVVQKENVNPYAQIDVSSMDMSYLPADYPKLTVKRASPVARVIYSRPHRQGRTIFGDLLKYGEPWRLGANESTEIEFFQPVTIQDKTVGRGKYIMYAIPLENQWTVVLNSNLFSWGLSPDPSKDLFRFIIPSEVKKQSVEHFTMVFQPSSTGADLVMAWDNVEARLPIQYAEK